MNRVIFYTRGGNTEKLAHAIAKGANTQAQRITPESVKEPADILFIGASIYAGQIHNTLREYLLKLEPGDAGLAVVFSTSAGRKHALQEVKEVLDPKGIKVLDQVYHCKGSFLGFVNRGRPNGLDLRGAEAFADQVCSE